MVYRALCALIAAASFTGSLVAQTRTWNTEIPCHRLQKNILSRYQLDAYDL